VRRAHDATYSQSVGVRQPSAHLGSGNQQQPWLCGSSSRAQMRADLQMAPTLARQMPLLHWPTSFWAWATTRRRRDCIR
jgi:hypothetical protein